MKMLKNMKRENLIALGAAIGIAIGFALDHPGLGLVFGVAVAALIANKK